MFLCFFGFSFFLFFHFFFLFFSFFLFFYFFLLIVGSRCVWGPIGRGVAPHKQKKSFCRRRSLERDGRAGRDARVPVAHVRVGDRPGFHLVRVRREVVRDVALDELDVHEETGLDRPAEEVELADRRRERALVHRVGQHARRARHVDDDAVAATEGVEVRLGVALEHRLVLVPHDDGLAAEHEARRVAARVRRDEPVEEAQRDALAPADDVAENVHELGREEGEKLLDERVPSVHETQKKSEKGTTSKKEKLKES